MAEFDEYRLQYEDSINEAIAVCGQPHEFYTRVKAEVLVDLLRKLSPPGTTDLLDIGCGNGMLHPHLLSSGLPLNITGIEVAAQFVEAARQANPDVSYDVYDGRTLPYQEASFDATFTICVMHHVPPKQWPEFLAEMRRVVRPGGLVAVFEHNPFNPMTAHIVKTCPLDRNAVLLRPDGLVKLMQEAGLATVAREFILFTPFGSPMFRRLDRLMRWLPLGAQYVCYGRVPQA